MSHSIIFSRTKKNLKHHVKCMYFKDSGSKKTKKVYIAILTDDYQYVEFDFCVLKNSITPSLASRIRSMFVDFEIDRKSIIIYDDIFSVQHPFYMYIEFLHEHMQFNFRKVSIDTIVKRIDTLHNYVRFKNKSRKIDRKCFNKIWNKLVELEKCPWISKEIENELKMKANYRARQSMICRMALYYVIVKEYLSGLSEKSQKKRLENSNMI